MGGIRGELARKCGEKLGTIKAAIQSDTDFVILTETKSHEYFKNKKLKFGMKPTLVTGRNRQAGVIVYSNPAYEIHVDSIRKSEPGGNYVCGVYKWKNANILVAGVYGESSNCDVIS